MGGEGRGRGRRRLVKFDFCLILGGMLGSGWKISIACLWVWLIGLVLVRFGAFYKRWICCLCFMSFPVVSIYFLDGGLERNSNMNCDFWDCSTIRYPPWASNLDRRPENDRIYTVWRYDGVHRNIFAFWCLFGLELQRCLGRGCGWFT